MKNSQVSYTEMKKIESDKQFPLIKLAFLDVGQADTIVISCPDTHEAIVVDCVDADSVLDYLEKERVAYLRGIIITHLHADHYSGVASLLNNYHLVPGLQECEVLAFNEIFNQKNLQNLSQDADDHSADFEISFGGRPNSVSTSLQNLVSWREQNKSKYALLQAQAGRLPFEGLLAKSLHLLHPYAADFRKLEAKGLNNTSVVLQVTGSGSSALLTGDIEPEGWLQLQINHPDLHSDLLKFPHHGAWKDGDADALLNSIKPSIVVISVGTEGYEKYKHPNPHVFTALSKYPHIRVLCTQATDQCQRSAQNETSSVVNQFKSHANENGYQLILSKRGCPCAGTVIIELDEEARVLQPEIKFHRERIIRPHFKDHKCNINHSML